MKIQFKILLGIIVWLLGMILDVLLMRYAYWLIHIGTFITVYWCIKWYLIKENRIHFKEKVKLKSDLSEMFKQVFDFSWSRVSIIWTICALWAMLLVHLGSLAIGSSGAYEEAIKSIRHDQLINKEAGEILQFTYMVSGNVTTRGTSNINIGIIGRNKNLRVNAIVEGDNGNYQTTKLEIQK